MNLLCIDPGPTVSGTLVLDTHTLEISSVCGAKDNQDLADWLSFLRETVCEHLAIEGMRGIYGSSKKHVVAGRPIIETLIWTGRFMQAFGIVDSTEVFRSDVNKFVAAEPSPGDAAIRQALIDRYPATGGGKTPQIGTKAKPGPLYGVSKHAWAALGVGHAWVAMSAENPYSSAERLRAHMFAGGAQ